MTAVAGGARRGRAARIRSAFAIARGFSPYLEGRRGRLALALLAALGVMAMKLLEPWPFKIIIDVYFFDLPPPAWLAGLLPPAPAEGSALLYGMIAAIVVIAAAGGFFFYVQRLATSATALEATSALRQDLFEAQLSGSVRAQESGRLGESLSRLTADVRALRDTFVSLPVRLVEDGVLMLGVAVAMFFVDPGLAVLALAGLPLVAWMSGRMGRPIRRFLAAQRIREGSVASGAAEAMRAAWLVQALVAGASETERLRGIDRRGVEAAAAAARRGAALQAFAGLLVGLMGAALIGLAAMRVTQGRLTPGDLVVFVAYLRTFFTPMRSAASLVERLSRASVAGERALALLNARSEVVERSGARVLERVEGALSFEGVEVRHGGGGPALRGIDLRITPGDRVVLTGPSGAGKSTLAALVPRFFDPDAGVVRLDGADLRDLKLADLRANVAILTQDPALFSMSVRDNIAYGASRATAQEVDAAARAAGVAEVLNALPEGLDTPVGEGGAGLSGGQRQCVAIARAMIRNSPVVILDEPTAGLDPELAEVVIEALRRLTEGRTVLSITHDPRLSRAGDRLLTLRNGRLVEETSAAGGKGEDGRA